MRNVGPGWTLLKRIKLLTPYSRGSNHLPHTREDQTTDCTIDFLSVLLATHFILNTTLHFAVADLYRDDHTSYYIRHTTFAVADLYRDDRPHPTGHPHFDAADIHWCRYPSLNIFSVLPVFCLCVAVGLVVGEDVLWAEHSATGERSVATVFLAKWTPDASGDGTNRRAGHLGRNRVVWGGIGWDGIGRDGIGWDRMGWYGMQ